MRTSWLHLRLTDDERARLEQAAQAAHMDLSDYVRGYLVDPDTETRAAAREVLTWLHMVVANVKPTKLDSVYRVELNVNLDRLVGMIDRLEAAIE